MRFCNPVCVKYKVSLLLLELHSERSCFLPFDSLSVYQSSEPSVHYVMAYSRSHWRDPHSAISRGHCTWQGAVL
jgi:hypothetical protein